MLLRQSVGVFSSGEALDRGLRAYVSLPPFQLFDSEAGLRADWIDNVLRPCNRQSSPSQVVRLR